MATNYTTGISEKELDNLLGKAFLNLDFNETKNEKMMEAIATQHLVNTTSFMSLLKKIFLNTFVITFIFIAVITALVIRNYYNTPAEKTVAIKTSATTITPNEPGYSEHYPPATQTVESTPVYGAIEPADPQQPDKNSLTPVPAISDRSDRPGQSGLQSGDGNQLTDRTYIFPVLTNEEIKFNNKQKKKMITALVKMNRDKYAYIPRGTADYRNKTISVNAFHLQATEVSNLEYRTFLHDLLIQGRKDDYLLALPDNEMWEKRFTYSYNEPMTNMYFWHSAYNNYPVVNISRHAAEMYCQWLTDETNKMLREDGKAELSLRLPTENEWAYAAMGGKTSVRYANAETSLRNADGMYLVNYLGYAIEECRYDSISNLYIPANNKHSFFEDGGYYTVSANSYPPNAYGLHCMAGNVSEMVTTAENKPASKGGSWFSCDYFLEIEARDEFNGETGPSPMIGFRPVVVFEE